MGDRLGLSDAEALADPGGMKASAIVMKMGARGIREAARRFGLMGNAASYDEAGPARRRLPDGHGRLDGIASGPGLGD